MRLLLLLLLTSIFIACKDKPPINEPTTSDVMLLDEATTISTIAFGSCNREDLPQPIWQEITAQNSDLWIWLGDNIYGDTDNLTLLKSKYDLQDTQSDYIKMRQRTPIIGIWDDHDYGANDAGKEYANRAESRDLMLEFLDVPASNPVWGREGGYQSYTIGESGKQIKIILLDGRYFRDSLQKTPTGEPRYFPNETGDILGEAQWTWLENELTNSTAQVHLVACGIQMLPTEQIFEKWANFPTARQRLLTLLESINPPNLLLMSGDRHIGEVTQITTDSLGITLTEVTSSGLTHSWESVEEINSNRISPLIGEKNYGLLQIDWEKTPLEATLQLRGLSDKVHHEMEIFK